jgi:hypothetical protein
MLPCANAVESSRARRGRKGNVQGDDLLEKAEKLGLQRCKATEAHTHSRVKSC